MVEFGHDLAARPHPGQFFNVGTFLRPNGGADPEGKTGVATAAEEFAVAPALDHVGEAAEGDGPEVVIGQPEGAEGKIQQVAPVSRPRLGAGQFFSSASVPGAGSSGLAGR